MSSRLFLFFFTLLIYSCQSSSNEDNSGEELKSFTRDTMVTSMDSLQNEPSVTYEDPDRTKWQNPSLVIDKLGNLADKTVADIGAGTGYFSFRLAREGAKVIAIDIEPEYLEYIDKRQVESIVTPGNYPVETRLSEENDPLLATAEADVVMLVNTYTYLNDRIDYLEKVKHGMSDDGIIAIVDYKDANNPVNNDAVIIIDPTTVADELKQAGFSNVVIDRNSLQYQYILIAKK